MRRTRVRHVLLIAGVVLLAVPGARAQDAEVILLDPNRPLIQDPRSVAPPQEAPRASIPAPVPGADAREVLSDLWFRHRGLLARGETEEATRQIETVLQFMKREGIGAAPEIAAAFQVEGRRALDEGDYRAALERFRLAARFNPDAASARFGLAAALLRGDRDLRGAAAEIGRGFTTRLTDPSVLHHLIGNGSFIAFLGACAGVGTALLLLCVQRAPALFHDLRERSRGRLSDESAGLIGWAILLLPVVVLLPIAACLAIWTALLFVYFRRGERVVASTLLLLLALGGPAGLALEWAFATASDPAARALIQAARSGASTEHTGALQQMVDDHPGETLLLFLLAGSQRAAGRVDDAMTTCRRALEIDPGNARVLINLGNLHALRQEYALAQNLYRRATEADPAMALARYNRHLAHLETFQLEAAEEDLREARRIDEALVGALLSRGVEGQERRTPVDAVWPAGEIWKRAFDLQMGSGLRRAWLQALGSPATLAGAGAILLAFIAPGLGIAPRAHMARRCRRCGRAYCRRCQVVTKYADHCSQCVHLFILRDGLAPAIKSRKLEEVQRYRRRIFIGERILSLVLPGGGHVLGGRTVLGAALLSVWGIAWIGLPLRGDLLVSPLSLEPATGPGTLIGFLAAALAAWLLGNLTDHERAQE
ncbi:MAG: tetratricopeptide repeat protein [Candidatus Polarisedimenticolia bacterium]